jgi:exopolysaccharide biosynthesis polyprenyl glycosylphosphotransferase
VSTERGTDGRDVLAAPSGALAGSRAVDHVSDLEEYLPHPGSRPEHRPGVNRWLVVADFHAVIIGLVLTTIIAGPVSAGPVETVLLIPVWIITARVYGLYSADDRRICHRTSDDLPHLLNWAIVSGAASALVVHPMALDEALILPATIFVSTVLLRWVARRAWRRFTGAERGLVLGTGILGARIARKLELEPGRHIDVVQRLDGPSRGRPSERARRAEMDDLREVLHTTFIDRVVVAQEDFAEDWLIEVVSLCRAENLKLTVVPPAASALGTAARLDHIAELPLIEFDRWRPTRATLFLKRAMDVAVALMALVLLAPVLIIVGTAIKIDSRGPVFFRQRRAGLKGRPFTVYKLRTMVVDAEDRLSEVVNLSELEEPMYKMSRDPRVTRVGRILRRTSLDEVPQFFNVLLGQMSLVGPRPEDARLVELYDDLARVRLEARPGITGPMQVYGRGNLTFRERLAVEREYTENHSFSKDMMILLRTASVVLGGHGAY